ncbi:GMC oxidoreductase-domain-containing protein [Cercophora newfieldiana]|uniref:GMC oxidoreductase-domain-containing protein n=1 Tax=Cercophora newfieldiana TaxID=92897 RepID=A0AA39YB32_9PEZI|nr:GMC oxidoreductase-domain-containing protein [Cercophora newfieldiana]
MGIYTKLPDSLNIDVLIAGGGTAGCIVAARLTEADPELSILVIEGGANNIGLLTVETPAFFIENLKPETKTNVFYQGYESEHLYGRAPVVPVGGVLGGGSSTNLMMYSRGMRPDYEWGPGWTADELLPYFKKLETYHGPDPTGRHGTDGPIHVSDGPFRGIRSENEFVDAALKIGFREAEDLQIFDVNHAVQRAKKFVSPDGKRQDTATRYLHPLLSDGKHPNLHVLVEHQVVRVLFDGTKAVGVEYKPNPDFRPDETTVHIIHANRMVIASCGALGTPLLLERSGVGNPSILSRAGVPVVVDLPGVGESYQDHNLLVYTFHSSLDPSDTMDPLATGRVSPADLFARNDPILGWNAQDITCKLRPSDADVTALGPDFQAAWDRDFKSAPERPLMLGSLVGAFPADPSLLPETPAQYFAISTFTAYPYSRGHVHISSPASTGDSLTRAVDFDPGFFSDPRDVKCHVWAYKTFRALARRMSSFRGEFAALNPPFPSTSAAFCAPDKLSGPLPADVAEITYTPEDDVILEKWLRENVGTTWHSLGTCAMKSREEGGVVDWGLNVHGTEGLKVVDLSVVPKNVAANTAATAMVIGERAAGLIIEELGLGKK